MKHYAKAYGIAAFILGLSILLGGCTPERRLQRLLSKNPQLNRIDTITVHDTIVVPGDTMWRSVLLRDTVTVENERQVVRIQRIRTGSPCDTVAIPLEIEGITKPDTVYQTVTVEVPRVVPCPEDAKVHRWWRTAALVLGVFSLALFILYRYPPNRNRE